MRIGNPKGLAVRGGSVGCGLGEYGEMGGYKETEKVVFSLLWAVFDVSGGLCACGCWWSVWKP